MTPQEQRREYRTVALLVAALANTCAATPEMVIDQLADVLWTTEEALQIKAALQSWE